MAPKVLVSMMSAPALDVFGVNLPNQVRITEIQFVVTAIDVDTLGVEHRSHRAVDDVNAIGFEEVFKGLHKIADCRLPIANFKNQQTRQLKIGNWQSAIKMSRAKQRGTSRLV